MEDLVHWLNACLDTDELWATEASRQRGGQPHPGGVHWQWVEPETDTPVVAGPSRDEHLTDEAENFRFSLRSVEEFPREHVGPLPLFAIRDVEEIPVAVAGHIAEHDPARVLREIDAKRQILDRYGELRAESKESGLIGDVTEEYQDFLLRLLATVYRDRPGFREEWAL